MKTLRQVTVTPRGAQVDGRTVAEGNLTAIYRATVEGGYPKFFKMDGLCRLGFIAAELLLAGESAELRVDAAVVLFNRSGSLVTDRNYQATIGDADYYPSPALFVYTLANIVTGEIAIRHKIHGETAFYILDAPDEAAVDRAVEEIYLTSAPSAVIAGWLEWISDSDYIAQLKLVTNTTNHMDNLISQLKEQIIDVLNLEDMTPADIDDQAPLFGEGLGLDSIDALELIVLLEREYGIKLANPAEGKAIFSSVASIADYVSRNCKK